MQEYYSILGVHPGASAAEIQKAFRDRIKLCHPDRNNGSEQADRARKLIEAYNRLRESTESRNTGPVGSQTRSRPGRHHQADGSAARDPHYETRSHHYEGPGKSGEKIFRSVFDESAFEFIERFRRSTGQSPYQSSFRNDHKGFPGSESSPYTDRSGQRVKEKPEPVDPVSGASPRARDAYYNAESFLRNVVKKYKKQAHRPRKQWARDYVRDLNLVQIKFRDVASGYPSIYTASMKRLRQVQELSEEVKKIMNG